MLKTKTKKVTTIKERIQDVIRTKAYEIHLRDKCNDELRNWHQAERELLGYTD